MNPHWDTNAMALFARVMQYGSLSETSRRVGIPISSLSRKISALEGQLGVRLLERTTRSLKPSEAGRELLIHCQQILEALEGTQSTLDRRQAELTGTLRLASPPSISEVLLAPWVEGFLARYPKVAVRVLVTDRHLDMVNEEVDVSLRVGRQTESSLVFKHLMVYRHILVAAPNYLAKSQPPSHPIDLKHHPLIGFSKWLGEVSWKLSSGGITEHLPVNLTFGINDYAGVLHAARCGLGIAEIPSILCREALREGQLTHLMPEWQFDEVDLSAYYLSRRNPSRLVESFLEHCLRHSFPL